MPINKHALIRYKTIDNCLRNRFRKWTLDDLVEACSEALYEFEGVHRGVSLRTVQLDIQNMRSEKLGYNAPIIVSEKKYYTYEDKNYSITNSPLTRQDLGTLSEVVDVLKQFRGFGYFSELNGMLSRLEDKLFRQQNKGKSYIHFETNDLLKGLDYIEPLHKAILNKTVLAVSYKSFRARSASDITFHPYLLKEYRNRWFIIGATGRGQIQNLALDRIEGLRELTDLRYHKSKDFDENTWFDDVIGVTKMPGQKPQRIVLRVDRETLPYLLTKPIHASQQLLREEENGALMSLDVIWNFELERELLGFGEKIRVLSPRRLVNVIKKRIGSASAQYNLSSSPE